MHRQRVEEAMRRGSGQLGRDRRPQSKAAVNGSTRLHVR